MNGINNIFNSTESPNNVREVSSRTDEINPKKRTKISDFDAPIVVNNFNFEELLPEMKQEVLSRLDEVSLISFSLISKAYHEKYYKPFNPHRFNGKCAKYGYKKLLEFNLSITGEQIDKFTAWSAVRKGQLEIFQMFDIIPLIKRPRESAFYILERFMNTAAKTNNLPILEWIGTQIRTYGAGSRLLAQCYSQSLVLGGYTELFYKHIDYLPQPIQHDKLVSAFIENGNLKELLFYLDFCQNDGFKLDNNTYLFLLHGSLYHGKFDIAQEFITKLPSFHQQETIDNLFLRINNIKFIELLYEHSTDQGKDLLLERIKEVGVLQGWTDFFKFFVKKGGRLEPNDFYKTLENRSGTIDLECIQYIQSNLRFDEVHKRTVQLESITKELMSWLQENGYDFIIKRSFWIIGEHSRKALLETVKCMMDSGIITQELFEMAIYLCDTELLERLWKEKEMLISNDVLVNFIEHMNSTIFGTNRDGRDWTRHLWIRPHYETIKWLLNKGFRWDIKHGRYIYNARYVYNNFIEVFNTKYPSFVKELISIGTFEGEENSQ